MTIWNLKSFSFVLSNAVRLISKNQNKFYNVRLINEDIYNVLTLLLLYEDLNKQAHKKLQSSNWLFNHMTWTHDHGYEIKYLDTLLKGTVLRIRKARSYLFPLKDKGKEKNKLYLSDEIIIILPVVSILHPAIKSFITMKNNWSPKTCVMKIKVRNFGRFKYDNIPIF